MYMLNDLAPGDRFYFTTDKNRVKYTLLDPPFELKKQKEFHIKYANCQADASQTTAPKPEQHKANRTVIFLRNNQTDSL